MTETSSNHDASESWVRDDLLLDDDSGTFFIAGLPVPSRQSQPTPSPEKLPPPLRDDWDTFFIDDLPAPSCQSQPTPGPEKLPPPLRDDWDTFFIDDLPAPSRQSQPSPGPEKLPPPDDLILEESLPSPMVSPSPADSTDCSVECMIPLSGVTQDHFQSWDILH